LLEAVADVPAGFVVAAAGSGFATRNATFYGQWRDERLLLGFRVIEQHTNLGGVLHGGMLATFADTLLPYAAMYQALGGRRFLPTISLQIDYLAPAAMGAWVQGEAEVLRMTRNMLFMQAIITADDIPIARVSGIFKLGKVTAELVGDFLNVKR
jgi:uncharacterized protein (TIGR00369 family)